MGKYVDRREAAKSYRPVAGSMSPGLQRAREQYRVKNAALGLALGAFAVGVWAYSISAVKQDVFDDLDDEVVRLETPSGAVSVPATAPGVPVPSVPSSSSVAQRVDNVRAARAALLPPTPASSSSTTPTPTSTPAVLPARGILQHLDHRLTRYLDPKNKTLVWGAPPVDNMGKMGDS